MTEMDGRSLDLKEENIQKIKQLFPEVVTENKIDFEKLQQILGEEIDTSKERYNFTWAGKSDTLRAAQSPSLGTLRPCKEDSKNWNDTENLYIEGDNLEVLKLLQKSYFEKVKMIYIDPPYNTGNDFVYFDNFKDSLNNYKKITGQVDEEGKSISTNSESNGRYHSDWLNMMYPRLKLARNLLKDEGYIFISIDDNELNNLKKICDEIFGEPNFVGTITWLKKRKGSFLSKNIISMTEYILVYSKKISNSSGLFGGFPDCNESQPILKRTNSPGQLVFPSKIIETKISDGILKKGVYGESINPIELINDAIVENGTISNSITISAPFIWNQKMLINEIKRGTKFVINTLNLQVRVFRKADINRYKGFSSIIDGVKIKGTNEDAYEELERDFAAKKIFDYSKPVHLLEELIKSATFFDKSAIILDFFSGSASLAKAIMNNNMEDCGNRKFIMVQLPEQTDSKSEAHKAGYKNICEIGKERIRRAGKQIEDKLKVKKNEDLFSQNICIDTGFKVFKLDTSNIKKWDPNIDKDDLALLDNIDNIKVDRTKEDLLYEIILKMGLELTYPIEEIKIGINTIYSVAFGVLMICLDDNISIRVAEEMVNQYNNLSPETWKVVFYDNGFDSDTDKTNIIEILKSSGLEEDNFRTI